MTISASLTTPRTGRALMLAPLVVGSIALGLLFYPECQAAVHVWLTSTAYGHCFLILPMAAYLVWDRRAALYRIPVQPLPRVAVLAVPLAVAWFAAERLGIMEGRQLVAMAALELLALSTLGWRLFNAMLGPLLYLFFLVPFGAFATPALQQVTAALAVAGLTILGIPNYTTDLTIEISAGTFYVAEACAGLRFLIASVAFGVFYALLSYRSPGRRAAFIAASIVVPVVANGLRALGIIVLGHVLGSAEAAAADHVVYGWVFFSFVLFLLILAGLPLRESAAPLIVHSPAPDARDFWPGPNWWPIVAVMLIACGPAASALLDHRAVPSPLSAAPGIRVPPGCTRLASTSEPSTRLIWQLACGTRIWDVTLQTFPPSATPEGLATERRRLTGELEAEDATATGFSTTPATGTWKLAETAHPYRVTATAAWVDGAPAQSGLAGRIQQAWNSVAGSGHSGVLMSFGTSLPGRLVPEQRAAVLNELRSLIEAQDNLTAQIDMLSRT